MVGLCKGNDTAERAAELLRECSRFRFAMDLVIGERARLARHFGHQQTDFAYVPVLSAIVDVLRRNADVLGLNIDARVVYIVAGVPCYALDMAFMEGIESQAHRALAAIN